MLCPARRLPRRARSFAPAALAAYLLIPPAFADFSFADFQSTAGINLVGLAGPAGFTLRVCPAIGHQAGAAWYATQQDVVSPWTSDFELQLFGGESGLAFVVQGADPNYLGGTDHELGYGGISQSLVIEFDTFQDLVAMDPSPNHVSVHSAGGGATSALEMDSIGQTSLLANLDDGQVHQVRVTYVPGSLAIFVDDMDLPTLQVTVDIAASLGLLGGQAWVGLTASTGDTWQSHDVLSWSFDEQAAGWGGNHAPLLPTITEPGVEGQVVSPFDVHLEADGFADPDAGDQHACTDWEIWTVMRSERVWRTACSSGPTLVHTHLADGVFQGSHAGQQELNENTAYVLRTRFRDNSGDASSEWGPWAERSFQTGDANSFYGLEAEDVNDSPGPEWFSAAGQAPVILEAGAVPPQIELASYQGDLLLRIEGLDGTQNLVTNPEALAEHVFVQLTISGGTTGLKLPATDLVITDDDCDTTRILLPEVDIQPGLLQRYWVSSEGSTWFAFGGTTEPVFTDLARGLALPWISTQPGYQVEVVAGDFTLPVNVLPVPMPGPNPTDPLLYVSELYGQIKVVRNDGSVGVYASGLLNYNPTGSFPGSGEQGMAGIAMDPVSGDLFASLLYDAGGPHYPKVIRLVSSDGGQTASSITTILDMPGESQGQSHFIAHLEWLPEGALMVHMGDGFLWGTAQNLDSFRGKFLRILPDGAPSPGNPLYDLSDGISARDYLYAWGVRNAFGGARRSSDGLYAFVENGPSVDRFSTLVKGRNYLWSGNDSSMMNFALYNWIPSHGPVECSFVERAVFEGSGFPEADQGDLFVTESGPTYAPGPQERGKRIVRFEVDSSGNLLSGPTTLVEYVGTGRATAAGIAAGPGGLYFTDLYADQGGLPVSSGAQVLRVRWVGETQSCELGTSYCGEGAPNSTGESAELHAEGSSHLSDNDLVLTAKHLPPQQFGYLLMSLTKDFVVGAGGSEGNLCLGGTIGRFATQVGSSGALGAIATTVDLSMLPGPLQGAVGAGELWNFQLWYRDANPGPTSNFTEALELEFH